MQFRTALNLWLYMFKLIKTPPKVINPTYTPPRTGLGTIKCDSSILHDQNRTRQSQGAGI